MSKPPGQQSGACQGLGQGTRDVLSWGQSLCFADETGVRRWLAQQCACTYHHGTMLLEMGPVVKKICYSSHLGSRVWVVVTSALLRTSAVGAPAMAAGDGCMRCGRPSLHRSRRARGPCSPCARQRPRSSPRVRSCRRRGACPAASGCPACGLGSTLTGPSDALLPVAFLVRCAPFLFASPGMRAKPVKGKQH